ncbi:MAG: hypothetical protein OXT03_03465, partial [Alphaproteobacteria bacterium]|nr:hypothetical protein [Alphaproteobacteria bacterium]
MLRRQIIFPTLSAYMRAYNIRAYMHAYMRAYNICAYLLLIVALVTLTSPSLAQAWRSGAALPQSVSGAVAASIDDRIYVLSGTVGTGIRRFFEVYDTRGDGWRPLPPMPVDRVQFGVAAGQGQIIVTGGRSIETGQFSDTVWRFNPTQSLWTQMPAMPGRRADHASAVIGNMLYVVGGAGAAAAHIYAYNLKQGRWAILPTQMPIPASQIAITTYGSKLVIVGGRDRNGRIIGAVQVYDTKANTWQKAPDLPAPRSGAAIGMLGDQLHVVG